MERRYGVGFLRIKKTKRLHKMEIDKTKTYQVSGALLKKLWFDTTAETRKQILLAKISVVEKCSIPVVSSFDYAFFKERADKEYQKAKFANTERESLIALAKAELLQEFAHLALNKQ
jgi:hypothetical protein